METTGKISVALIDDHVLFREGLSGLLAREGSCHITAQASNGQQFIDLLEGGARVDVALLDIDMPVLGGFQTVQICAERFPEVRVVVISMHAHQEYYFRMISHGAKGFLLKSSELGEVLTAIRSVSRGGTYFSQELLTSLVAARSPHAAPPGSALSERETEVLELICRGFSNSEIADRLFISKRTVDKHRANILEKTGTKNTAHLVMFAVKNALVEL